MKNNIRNKKEVFLNKNIIITNLPTKPKNGGNPANDKNRNTRLLIKNDVWVKIFRLFSVFKSFKFIENKSKKKNNNVKM